MTRGARPVALLLLGVLALYALGVGLLYRYQRDLLFIGAARPSALPPLPGGYRDIRVGAADGTPLRAWYRPPAPGRPVLIFFHGNGDTIAGSAVAVRPFIDAGDEVLLPEFRGYGGMPGRPSEALLTSDARRFRGWLAEQGIGDDWIVVIGYSLGSGVATQLATEFRPRALILFAGFASIDRVAAAKFWVLPVRLLLTEHFDNAAKLPHVAAPLLLLHGTADRTVPYDNLGVLVGARPDATALTFPGISHDVVFLPKPVAKALDWLENARR